ncbi:NLI interacting factor-like phosphatase family protein [Tritrichomonas foetus]|uniref:Mitochondrial import inner membrane translocase subunit TIM50 n=1 Tax=Tritrichomonas foetus TaxID=1144522 RepID=A0A1J4J4F9_9EUKA|nr:NLI interacting factor-like phosphatase family protein [Tritrichomonas foetus]|eukprot:OHS93039.1 NLI interacting factor-like phosphatase family protein [Tritrichomonas foetus]
MLFNSINMEDATIAPSSRMTGEGNQSLHNNTSNATCRASQRKKTMTRSSSSQFVPKPAIVLDLDDTLVHVSPIKPKTSDFTTICVRRRRLYVQSRPNLRQFINRLSKHYDIFIFTAAAKDYANSIVDKLMPEIHSCRRLFRDSCTNMNGYSVKDLKKLRRPLSQTLLVDDIAGSALQNPDNLIRIEPWSGEKCDDALVGELMPVLERIAYEKDIGAAYKEVLKQRKFQNISTF